MGNGMGLCTEFLLCQRSLSATTQSSLISRGSRNIASRYHLLHRLSRARLLCLRQLHVNNGNKGHSDLLQGPNDYVIRSPYPDLDIPENVSLSHFLMDKFPKIQQLNGSGRWHNWSGNHIFAAAYVSCKVTSAFVKLGLGRGDVVTLFSPNCPQFAIATIAIGSAGAIFSPVSPSYTTGELKDAMSLVKSRFLITIPALLPIARAAVQQCPSVKEIIVFGEAERCRPFSSLLEDDLSKFPENIDFHPKENIAALLFSSGTTGLPKAVMLSHYNLVANVQQILERQTSVGYKSGVECLLGILPFFHIYGLTAVMNCGLASGAKIVTLPNFKPASFLESIQKYRTTFLLVVPPLSLFLATNLLVAKYDLSSVRDVIVGGAPASVSITNELVNRFQNQFICRQAYGLTETSPLTHCNESKGNKYHTVGLAVNNTQFKVVDVETRKLLGPDESGELCIRGPQVMMGYYGNKEATAETLVDGWLNTGDVGHYDNDGHMIISDRIKEMIKVKGLQVAPAELEAILVSHPSVHDAAVIGLKDERLGEAPKAFVVLKPQAKVSAEELKQFVGERVAPYKKLVGGIEFRSEIPKSASGKILRRILKEEISSK